MGGAEKGFPTPYSGAPVSSKTLSVSDPSTANRTTVRSVHSHTFASVSLLVVPSCISSTASPAITQPTKRTTRSAVAGIRRFTATLSNQPSHAVFQADGRPATNSTAPMEIAVWGRLNR